MKLINILNALLSSQNWPNLVLYKRSTATSSISITIAFISSGCVVIKVPTSAAVAAAPDIITLLLSILLTLSPSCWLSCSFNCSVAAAAVVAHVDGLVNDNGTLVSNISVGLSFGSLSFSVGNLKVTDGLLFVRGIGFVAVRNIVVGVCACVVEQSATNWSPMTL
ncbi:hypothetical protein FF38_03548 [Lucilia cuprina]|uniref:Uncharacterized protein n=1 Tax=Lucilia cuprina TaxID=7375 RepID=A0A0L0C508_LUCCU|nr:hypothetical protein FF38_03548 [Lucilia cuprina]